MTEADARHTVLIDEAELVLRMFAFLTQRDGVPREPARQVLALIEEKIAAEHDEFDKAALMMATDLTKIAMRWLSETMNRHGEDLGLGHLAKKISKEQARQ